MISLQSLVCLNSYVNSLFNKRTARYVKIQNKDVLLVVKLDIRRIVLELLNTVWETKLRKIVDGMFVAIIKDNSDCFEDLLSIASYWIEELAPSLETRTFELNNQNLLKFKTLASCFNELRPKRLMINHIAYKANILDLIGKIAYFWKYITDHLSQLDSLSTKEALNLATFNKTVDRCLLYSILIGNNSSNEDPRIIECIQKLMIKCEGLLQIIRKHEHGDLHLDDDVVDKIEQSCVVLTFDFSDILSVSPLVLSSFIENFLAYSLAIFEIRWNRENLQKGVSLLFYKILKTFLFYSAPDDIQQKKFSTKLKISVEAQLICYNAYMKFFDDEKRIREIMSYIISNLMIYKEAYEDFEAFIDDQESTGIDTIHSELECSLPKIGALIIEQLFYRFPKIALPIYYESLEEVISQKVVLPESLQDSVFNIVGYLPKVYSFLGLEDQKINIMQVIEYLNAKSKMNVVFARRFLIVLKHFIYILNFDDKKQLAKTIIDFLHMDDNVVQFEALECLATLIKIDHDLELDYPLLIRLTTPIFVKMLKCFQTPSLVMKLSLYLLNVLEKSQYNLSPEVLLALRDLDISSIIERNPAVMKPTIADILNYLILGFSEQQSNVIFILAVEFICICVSSFENEDATTLLRFTCLTLRHMKSVTDNTDKIQIVKNQFLNSFNKFYAIVDADIYVSMLAIIEELILMGLNPVELDYWKVLTTFYSDCSKFDAHDSNLLKCSIFSIYTTLFLIAKENNQFSMAAFEVS